MKKRYLVCAALLAACVAVVVVVLMLLPARPGVTKANFDRLEKGMTLAEVNEVFGQSRMTVTVPQGRPVTWNWMAHDGSTAVIDFKGDAVVGLTWHNPDESILDTVYRWLSISNNPIPSQPVPTGDLVPAAVAPTPPMSWALDPDAKY